MMQKGLLGIVLAFAFVLFGAANATAADVTEHMIWRDGTAGFFTVTLDSAPLGAERLHYTEDGLMRFAVNGNTMPVPVDLNFALNLGLRGSLYTPELTIVTIRPGTTVVMEIPQDLFDEFNIIADIRKAYAGGQMFVHGGTVSFTFEAPGYYGFVLFMGRLTDFGKMGFRVTDEIGVFINGTFHSFEIPPLIIDGRTMLPLRAIGEALGMTVEFDEATNTAILTRYCGMIITHQIGTAAVAIDGMVSGFDVESVIIEGRTLVPVRMLAEAINAEVEWNEAVRAVIIEE